jgi:26S proteasome regulatory subunit N1
MAQNDGRPSAAEKGKGKVDDVNGDKGKVTDEKDGKPTANGKVVDGLQEGEQHGECDRIWAA